MSGYLLFGTFPLGWISPTANVLIIAGYGLRWRAARQFGGRSNGWLVLTIAPCGIVTLLFSLPSLVAYDSAYRMVCGLIAAQTSCVAWEFWRDRSDRLPSRYGLVFAYLAAAAVFLFRFFEGFFQTYGMESSIPAGITVSICLLLLVLHTVGAGAFSLSIAFERRVDRQRLLALTDVLTALPNRRAFEERFGTAVAERRSDATLAILDIDHFKRVNDTFGHGVGDAVLKACAEILTKATPDEAFLARIGGEEFAILFDGRSLMEAEVALERVRRAVEAAVIPAAGQTIGITVSVGMIHMTTGFADTTTPMQLADRHLYAAKEGGRNRLAMAA